MVCSAPLPSIIVVHTEEGPTHLTHSQFQLLLSMGRLGEVIFVLEPLLQEAWCPPPFDNTFWTRYLQGQLDFLEPLRLVLVVVLVVDLILGLLSSAAAAVRRSGWVVAIHCYLTLLYRSCNYLKYILRTAGWPRGTNNNGTWYDTAVHCPLYGFHYKHALPTKDILHTLMHKSTSLILQLTPTHLIIYRK